MNEEVSVAADRPAAGPSEDRENARPDGSPAAWRTATLLFLIVAVYRIVLVQLVPVSYVSDEGTWMIASRWFWLVGEPRTHAGRMPVLLPAILSPLFGLLDFERAYAAAKTLNALLVSAALFPIWRLARRFAGETFALGVAVISVCGIPGTYAAVVMAEGLFFLLLWVFLASFAALVERPTARSAVSTALAGTALAATKPQAIPALAVVAVALAANGLLLARSAGPESRSAATRRNRSLAAVGLLVVGLGTVTWINGGTLAGEFYSATGSKYPLRAVPFLAEVAGLTALMILATGILPFSSLIARKPDRGLGAPSAETRLITWTLLALTAGYLVLAASFGSVVSYDRLPERYVSFVYPAVLILALFVWARSARSVRPAAAALIGFGTGALLLYGLSRCPAPYVLDIEAAPTRAALLLRQMARDPSVTASPRDLLAVSALGGLLAAAGSLMKRPRARLVAAGVLTGTLGLLASISQIVWTSRWATNRYLRARVESVVIPRNAGVVLVSDGVPSDMLLAEVARRPDRIQVIPSSALAVRGSGFIGGFSEIRPQEEYWVTPAEFRLRNDLVHAGRDFRIYRMVEPPRLISHLRAAAVSPSSSRLEIVYYPSDPFLEAAVFVLETSLETASEISLRISDATGGMLRESVGAGDRAYEFPARRGKADSFRVVIEAARPPGPLRVAPDFLKAVFVKTPDGRVLDDLYP